MQNQLNPEVAQHDFEVIGYSETGHVTIRKTLRNKTLDEIQHFCDELVKLETTSSVEYRKIK